MFIDIKSCKILKPKVKVDPLKLSLFIYLTLQHLETNDFMTTMTYCMPLS